MHLCVFRIIDLKFPRNVLLLTVAFAAALGDDGGFQLTMFDNARGNSVLSISSDYQDRKFIWSAASYFVETNVVTKTSI